MSCEPTFWSEAETFQSYHYSNIPVPDYLRQFDIAENALREYELDPENGLEKLLAIFSRCGSNVKIGNGFACDLGKNITIGSNVSIGRNVVILDMGPVVIGDNVNVEDSVHIYNASHRVATHNRWRWFRYSKISIGNDVTIRKNSVLLPGSQIQSGSVIGRGSVVKGRVGSTDVISANEIASELYPALLGRDWLAETLANSHRPQIPYLDNKNNIIKRPFFYRRGYNIQGGENGYGLINVHAVFDDSCRIFLGNSCLIGPGVSLLTDLQCIGPEVSRIVHEIVGPQSIPREKGPIVLGENVWLAGRVTVLPGVSIGNNSAVLAPNRTISQDVPANSIVFVGDDGQLKTRRIEFC